jgi:hypothetical protein
MEALNGMLYGIQSVILSLFHDCPITLTLETEDDGTPLYQIALYNIIAPLYTAIEERCFNQLKVTSFPAAGVTLKVSRLACMVDLQSWIFQ